MSVLNKNQRGDLLHFCCTQFWWIVAGVQDSLNLLLHCSGECIAEEKSFASVLDAQFCSTHCNLCAAPAPQPVPCPTCAAARSPPCRELQNVEDLKIIRLDLTLSKAPRNRHWALKKLTFYNSGLIFGPNLIPQVLQPRMSRESPLFVSQVWVSIAGKFPGFFLITSWQMTDDETRKTYLTIPPPNQQNI